MRGEEEEAGWHDIGAHRYRFEPPDLVLLRDHGDVSPEEMQRIAEMIQRFRVVAGKPVCFINDISAMGDLPADTRKLAALGDALNSIRAIALVGADLRRRILARLVINAAKLARRPGNLPPIVFFSIEAEARAWIEGFRRGE